MKSFLIALSMPIENIYARQPASQLLFKCECIMIMKYLSHYGPSLCVKFHENWILAAYGPFIHIYDYRSGELLNVCRIFHRNKVHGIKISNLGKVILFGARSLSILELDAVRNSRSLLQYEKLTGEWITSGEFSYKGDQIYLLTCYNKVLICDLQGNVISTKTIYRERSILYSGSIKAFSEDGIFINAGTVMGGIIVWDLLTASKLHNLNGHAGSIFYVTISDNGKYVASCSDDRSVRLWDLKSGKQLSVGWGHTARIWNLKFFDSDTKVMSVSEDCTCRVWGINDDNEGNFVLVQETVYEVHLSKNVWGVDIEENDMIVVTSGNDGRLKLTDLKQLSRYENTEKTYTLEDISRTSGLNFEKGEIIKGFHGYDFGLIAMTSLGKVIAYYFSDRSWELVALDKRFISNNTTSGISDANVVVFSNNRCDLLLMKFTDDGRKIIAKKEMQIKELSKTNNIIVCNFDPEYFLVTLESPNSCDNFVCLKFNINCLEVKNRYDLVKPENFASSCLEVYQNFILVGSRFSSLAIFDLENVETQPLVIRRITPGDTTTSIKYVESKNGYQVFALTNRDGYYNMIKLDLGNANEEKRYASIIHSNKIDRGFLEGAFFDKNGDYVTYGFKSSMFHIYNETKGYEIASQACGGAHRQWKLFTSGGELLLVYIKASALVMRRFHRQLVPELLCAGTHGREIRDITIQKSNEYKDGYLFCTGSEDTTIKLFHMNKSSGALTHYWTQRKHVSGLQRCKFIDDQLMISSSAKEELFLWELNTEGESRPYMTLKQNLPTSSTNPDLRIMDFAVLFVQDSHDFILATVYSDSAIKIWHYDYEKNTFRIIIDGRYETCCLLNVSLIIFQNQICMILCPTDGHLVIYNITEHIPFAPNQNNKKLIKKQVSMRLVHLPGYDCRFRVHQSGIKTVSLNTDLHDTVKIYTGGDDNSLGISILHIDEKTSKIAGSVQSLEPNAAASTITSSYLISRAAKLVTTSVDQIVRVWDVSKDKLVLEEKRYTTVADTGTSDCVDIDDSTTLLLVGGVGLSSWVLQ